MIWRRRVYCTIDHIMSQAQAKIVGDVLALTAWYVHAQGDGSVDVA
jgi:hypothetical protein